MKAMAAEGGFSLTEMMVVLAIIALASAVSLPYVHKSSPQSELKAASNKLATTLRRARAKAMSTGSPALVTIDVEEGTFSSASEEKTEKLGDAITLSTLSAGDISLAPKASYKFFPDGGATGGRIIMKREGIRVITAINWLTGAITIDDAVTEPGSQ